MENRTLYSASIKQPSFWTAVFGMGMIAEILARRRMRNIGKRNELEIRLVMPM